MTGRARGRANPNQDTDEERRLWKEIKDKSKEVDEMVSRSNKIGHEIIEVEAQQAVLVEQDKPSSAALDERLEKLYRENVKLCEEVQHIIEGKSNDTNLLDSIKILAGLREASEESAALLQASQPTQRAASGKLNRPPKKGASRASAAASVEETDDVSAAPSPRHGVSLSSRLNAKDKVNRQGSISTTREASVKLDDGAESVASSADGVASNAGGSTNVALKGQAGSRGTHRLVLTKGERVFCRHDLKSFDAKKGEQPEGEGILCRVTAVIGEGKQRRYEVQDADTSGDPEPPQRASISQLMQIPENNRGLSDLPKGKHVLAQYPNTTTFYKAEVSETWKSVSGDSKEKSDVVRLNFQDDEQSREVERRFVLTEK